MINPSITNLLEVETSFQKTSLDFRQGYVLEHILERLFYKKSMLMRQPRSNNTSQFQIIVNEAKHHMWQM